MRVKADLLPALFAPDCIINRPAWAAAICGCFGEKN
jgi:hypothetical protein